MTSAVNGDGADQDEVPDTAMKSRFSQTLHALMIEAIVV
jgi:hypothetical protein